MTAYNSTQWNGGIAEVGSGPMGDLKVLYGSIEIGTALSSSDTINMFKFFIKSLF